VLESALDAAMTEHLGYEVYGAAGREGGYPSGHGARSQTVFTELRPVEIERFRVPRRQPIA
jgi:hypothetical protein